MADIWFLLEKKVHQQTFGFPSQEAPSHLVADFWYLLKKKLHQSLLVLLFHSLLKSAEHPLGCTTIERT